MRPDFAKVVTERPRDGSSAPCGVQHKGRSQELILDEDFSKKREPMSKGRGTKRFTDVLGPLRGYLRQQIGRPWDKVYSELCQHFNKNSVSQSHVLDHVKDYVELKIQYVLKGKKKFPYDTQGVPVYSSSDKHFQLFVCPESGILKMAPIRNWRKEYRKSQEKDRPKCIDGKFYMEDSDKIWYELEIEYVPKKEWHLVIAFDVFKKTTVFGSKWNFYNYTYGKECCYAKSKRQLNKKEIRKLKLRD